MVSAFAKPTCQGETQALREQTESKIGTVPGAGQRTGTMGSVYVGGRGSGTAWEVTGSSTGENLCVGIWGMSRIC